MVLGGHGDDMVPLAPATAPSTASRSRKLIAKEKLDAIVERTRKGGGEIVELLGHQRLLRPGRARDRDGRGYLHDQKRLLPCAALPRRASTATRTSSWACPSSSARGGVEKIVELELTDDEKAMLEKTAESVKKSVAETKL